MRSWTGSVKWTLDLERLDTVFLIDSNAKFSGAVAVGRLLFAEPDERMEALKMEPLLSVPPDADDKEVFELFDKYNLHSLAVVDALKPPDRRDRSGRRRIRAFEAARAKRILRLDRPLATAKTILDRAMAILGKPEPDKQQAPETAALTARWKLIPGWVEPWRVRLSDWGRRTASGADA